MIAIMTPIRPGLQGPTIWIQRVTLATCPITVHTIVLFAAITLITAVTLAYCKLTIGNRLILYATRITRIVLSVPT